MLGRDLSPNFDPKTINALIGSVIHKNTSLTSFFSPLVLAFTFRFRLHFSILFLTHFSKPNRSARRSQIHSESNAGNLRFTLRFLLLRKFEEMKENFE